MSHIIYPFHNCNSINPKTKSITSSFTTNTSMATTPTQPSKDDTDHDGPLSSSSPQQDQQPNVDGEGYNKDNDKVYLKSLSVKQQDSSLPTFQKMDVVMDDHDDDDEEDDDDQDREEDEVIALPTAAATSVPSLSNSIDSKNADANTGADTLKINTGLLPFPENLMSLLDSDKVSDIIRWLHDGDAFCLIPSLFAEHVLDKYFQGTKFESFTRKLNRWGFKRVAGQKVPPNTVAYYHKDFIRGSPKLLKNMNGGKAKNITARDKLIHNAQRHHQPKQNEHHDMKQVDMMKDYGSNSISAMDEKRNFLANNNLLFNHPSQLQLLALEQELHHRKLQQQLLLDQANNRSMLQQSHLFDTAGTNPALFMFQQQQQQQQNRRELELQMALLRQRNHLMMQQQAAAMKDTNITPNTTAAIMSSQNQWLAAAALAPQQPTSLSIGRNYGNVTMNDLQQQLSSRLQNESTLTSSNDGLSSTERLLLAQQLSPTNAMRNTISNTTLNNNLTNSPDSSALLQRFIELQEASNNKNNTSSSLPTNTNSALLSSPPPSTSTAHAGSDSTINNTGGLLSDRQILELFLLQQQQQHSQNSK
jgi:hypothetical protein